MAGCGGCFGFRGRAGALPADFGETVASILHSWGTHNHPDEREFYACSPHRIEMTARLLRHSYIPEYSDEMLLVPRTSR